MEKISFLEFNILKMSIDVNHLGPIQKCTFTLYLCQFVTPLCPFPLFVRTNDHPTPRLHPSSYLQYKENPEIQFKVKQKFGCH